MSVKIMGDVWELDIPRNETMVLLALADHADHEGNNVFPSNELVAWKTGYTRESVNRIISSLRNRGILVATGNRDSGTIIYSIDTSAAPRKAAYGCDKKSHPVDDGGVTKNHTTCDKKSQGVCEKITGGVTKNHTNRQLTINEPSSNRLTAARSASERVNTSRSKLKKQNDELDAALARMERECEEAPQSERLGEWSGNAGKIIKAHCKKQGKSPDELLALWQGVKAGKHTIDTSCVGWMIHCAQTQKWAAPNEFHDNKKFRRDPSGYRGPPPASSDEAQERAKAHAEREASLAEWHRQRKAQRERGAVA